MGWRTRSGAAPPMLAMAVLVAALLLAPRAACGAGVVDGDAETHTSVKSFFVGRKDSGSQTVTLHGAACRFTFDTREAPQAAAAAAATAEGPSVKDSAAVIEGLAGRCIKHKEGFWMYSVCLGAGELIEQQHSAERYTLGKGWTVPAGGTTALFSGGSPCDANGGAPRTTTVEFLCDNREHVMSIEEQTTCNYRVRLATPAVCEHHAFAKAGGRGAGGTGVPDNRPAAGQAVDRQPWVVEVEELDDGQLSCVAYSTDDLKKAAEAGSGSSPVFTAWGMEVWHTDKTALLQPTRSLARRDNRVPLTAGQVIVHTPAGPNVPVTMGNPPFFARVAASQAAAAAAPVAAAAVSADGKPVSTDLEFATLRVRRVARQ